MKFLIASLFSSVALADYETLFMQYVAEYSKNYGTMEEFKFRMGRFIETHLEILDHNNTEGELFELAHNVMSDWTESEYTRLLGYKEHLRRGEPVQEEVELVANGQLPASVDWRTKNAVTPVKDQGQCGSCWAFSSTGAMEGAHAIEAGELLSFSEQQLVSCSTKNSGCNGGLQDLAFKYAEKNFMELEATYPYTSGKGKDGECKYSAKKATNVEVKSYTNVKKKNVTQMKTAVVQQPLSVSVDASGRKFMNYKKGIYTKVPRIARLDHATLVVGYGTDKGQDYWIMKNSWGTSWGEQGYMKVLMVEDSVGAAAIQKEPLFPYTDI